MALCRTANKNRNRLVSSSVENISVTAYFENRLKFRAAATNRMKTVLGVNLYIGHYAKTFNSSDGRVVRVSASEAVDSGLISSRVEPMTIKLVFTASLLDTQH